MTLIELEGFTTERWTGNVLPVLFDGDRLCSRCSGGTVVALDPWVAVPLFRHGGYGEAVRRSVSVCLACARSSVDRVESLNPRAFA